MAARDPYKYYRIEARELVETLGSGVVKLDRGAGDKDVCAQLLRAAHTLKGAARVVKHPAVAELAHEFEERLGEHRDGSALAAAKVSELLRMVDAMSDHVAGLDAQKLSSANANVTAVPASPPEKAGLGLGLVHGSGPGSGPPAPKPAVGGAGSGPVNVNEPEPEPGPSPVRASAGAADAFATVRVDVSDMDSLLAGVTEAAVQLTALDREAVALANVRRTAALLAELCGGGRAQALAHELQSALERIGHGLTAGLNRAEAEVREVRERANTLRLVPAGSIFSNLERAARDAGAELGRRVALSVAGGEHRLDGHILGPVRDALLHVVRNAVAHGVESEIERAAAGKPAAGAVELSVERRGGRLAFVCKDDGRGIDVAAVARVAVATGRLDPADAAGLDVAGAVRLLVAGGVSTHGRVSAIAGRGIGLDAVQALVNGVKGELRVTSQPGRGTRVEIIVPLSLSSMRALVVEAGGMIASIPLDAVQRTLRVSQDAIARSAEGDTLFDRDEAMPFVELGRVLGARAAGEARAANSVVIVVTGAGRAAFGVDRMLGTADILVRPLPAAAGKPRAVLGASFDADGDPRPVLDPDGMVLAARGAPARGVAPASERRRVLVIDDSLTTRTLEQSILEAAGYDVDLAVCGEDGLARAREHRYALFVCDVEMPGMNGFEFVAKTRADLTLRETPAVLMTSLGSPEHRKRGVEAGASDYIVKGEFDQTAFLETVNRLARWS